MGRVDYLHALAYNQCYCMAVEKLLGLEVPERAEYIRVITANSTASRPPVVVRRLPHGPGSLYPHPLLLRRPGTNPGPLDGITGSRLTYCFFRFGGVPVDLDDDFVAGCRGFVSRLRSRWDDYNNLVTKNVIFINRTRDVGIITRDQCIKYGLTGPNLRGSGIPYDIRKSEPYSAYPEFDFEIPIGDRATFSTAISCAWRRWSRAAHHRAGLQ
jgi:NADH-quinone oxidoreductase subunit D